MDSVQIAWETLKIKRMAAQRALCTRSPFRASRGLYLSGVEPGLVHKMEPLSLFLTIS